MTDTINHSAVQLTQRMLCQGQEVTNVHILQVNGESGQADAATVSLSGMLLCWQTQSWNSFQRDLLPEGLTLVEMVLKVISGVTRTAVGTGFRYFFTTTVEESRLPSFGTEPGTLVGPVLPTYSAASIRLKANTDFGTARGGKRFGPLMEDNVGVGTDDNLILPAYRASVQTWVNKFNTGFLFSEGGGNWSLKAICVDKVSAFAAGTVAGHYGIVSLYRVHSRVSSQVSRKAPLD